MRIHTQTDEIDREEEGKERQPEMLCSVNCDNWQDERDVVLPPNY